MSRERIVAMPPSDYALFLELQGEVGKLDYPTIMVAEGVGRWYNEDLESSEMAVRGIVREATLERVGFQEKDWIADEDDISSSLEDLPEVKSVLGEPSFINYRWQKVSAKSMGNFADLRQNSDDNTIIDTQSGVVLFSDEVQQLADGQTVTTLHSSGFGMGFVAERKEAYKVVEGGLQRVRATIVD